MTTTYDTATGTFVTEGQGTGRRSNAPHNRSRRRNGNQRYRSGRVGQAASKAWDMGYGMYEDNGIFRFLSWFMLLSLVVGLFIVIKMNIQPYYTMLSQGQEDGWAMAIVKAIPVVGGAIRSFDATITAVGAFFIWGLTQCAQCLWLIIRIDRKANQNAMIRSNAIRVRVGTGHTGRDLKMAKRTIGIPYFFIRWSGLISLGAYVFDLILGLSEYPLAESTEKFWFYLNTGMVDKLDIAHLRNLLVMMFTFEALLYPTIIIWQWIQIRNREEVIDG